tara:strand:+ start:2309 stop:3406 length:1098 start_codon:yes stop_codon:yes gene_type:complete
MKILFHLGHPAHFHLFKNTILNLTQQGHKTSIIIKKKDILEELLINEGLKYKNILPEGRKNSKISIAIGLLKQDFQILKYCLKYKPNLLVGTSVPICHVGKFLGIPSINLNEDDASVVPLYSKLAYPFADIILSPTCCNNMKWDKKTIKYPGFHELAYLHPNNFKPNIKVCEKYIDTKEPFFILRFSSLNAHHDKGVKGINDKIALKLIEIIKPHGKVLITSERPLNSLLEKYRIKINPLDMHNFLAFAKMYIGDSQTMAAEAGVLGTPFIRFNDFVSKIGYLNEIENKYNLGYGFKPIEIDKMFSKIKELLFEADLKQKWIYKKNKMINDKIDVSEFLTWFISDYPKSKLMLLKKSNYIDNFYL